MNSSRRDVYDLLTGKIAPYASEDGAIFFDRIVNAPVDDETVGLVAEAIIDSDPQTRRAGLFVFAGLQDESPERLQAFRPLVKTIHKLLLDDNSDVRCDALMAYAFFDPGDLSEAVHEFLSDPAGRNRLQAVRILEAEQNPRNLPTLLTLGVDPYHEESDEDFQEWLVVREAARSAIQKTAQMTFPDLVDLEEIEGVPCHFHVWDPVWNWAVRSGIKGRG
jgi:HEAT repeat protein